MAPKHVPPSTNLVSFNCPNCGAMAHQSWYQVHADSMKKNKTPDIGTDELVVEIAKDLGITVICHNKNSGYGANQKTCYDPL